MVTFRENLILANWLIKLSRVPNAHGCRIPVRSSWDLDKLEKYLTDYEDKAVVEYLRYGWPVGCVHSGDQVIPTNHKGALVNRDEVVEMLHKQAQRGSLIGPLEQNPFGTRARFSPLNTRIKRDSEDLRLIVDLSSPRGTSINDGTPKDFFLDKEHELHFPTVDSLIDIIHKKGSGCKLYKVDRKSAYKFENLDPGDVHLMGMVVDGKFYFDSTLVMGARHAAGCCHRTTSALIYIHNSHGYDSTCFIDDMAGGEIEARADEAFQHLRDLLNELNVLEAFDKACKPSTIMVFLGILFNTVLMTMEVTPDRLREVNAELIRWLSKQYTTLRQLQSLVGKLSFCASTVRAGRLFFSRILEFMKGVGVRGYVPVPEQVHLDLKWWIRFMHEFNGVSLIQDQLWATPDCTFSTDSTLTRAGGWAPASFTGSGFNEYFTFEYPTDLVKEQQVSINELEALALLIGIRLWGKYCARKKLLVHCDNQATVHNVNQGRTTNSFAQACMRELHYWCAKANCQIKAKHIKSNENTLPDLLSRWDDDSYKAEFLDITRYMEKKQIHVQQDCVRFSHNW